MLCIGLNFMLSHAPEDFQSLQRKFSVHFFPGKAGSRHFKTRIVFLFLSLLFMMIHTGTQTVSIFWTMIFYLYTGGTPYVHIFFCLPRDMNSMKNVLTYA
jgi:hypothetical protein